MAESDNYIAPLLSMLERVGWERHHAALTALVAERDELQSKVNAHAEDRRQYIEAWAHWIEFKSALGIEEWLRVYADAVPAPPPDGDEAKRRIYDHLDQRMRDAADMITALVAERDALRIELERERLRLSACGVAAMSNTRQTAEENRQVSDEYKSASFDEVCAAVDREMALRERVAELEAQPPAVSDLRERLLESALRGVSPAGAYDKRGSESLGRAAVWMVDAAIAEMRKGDSDGK